MQTLKDLATELKLTPQATAKLEQFVNQLVIELLQSIQEDNNRNFDETVANLKNPA
ncbi:MAG: hypothetical protein WCV93_04400 [Candidatus Shapirobacteria bacterium]|jgi:hypothetical protein